MTTYPIERGKTGFWFVWSLPADATTDRNAEGLETFASYDEAAAKCAQRNRAKRDIDTTEHYPDIWTAVDYATYDGPPAPVGIGKTEQEAISDLIAQLDKNS